MGQGYCLMKICHETEIVAPAFLGMTSTSKAFWGVAREGLFQSRSQMPGL